MKAYFSTFGTIKSAQLLYIAISARTFAGAQALSDRLPTSITQWRSCTTRQGANGSPSVPYIVCVTVPPWLVRLFVRGVWYILREQVTVQGVAIPKISKVLLYVPNLASLSS